MKAVLIYVQIPGTIQSVPSGVAVVSDGSIAMFEKIQELALKASERTRRKKNVSPVSVRRAVMLALRSCGYDIGAYDVITLGTEYVAPKSL